MESFSSENEYRIISSTVVKCFSILCISAIIVLWGNSCKLGTTTIQECQDACTSSNSQMLSVTHRECVCQSARGDQWVIPSR